jgi:hypothetical protein
MIIDQITFRSLLGKGERLEYVAHRHIFKLYPKLFKILLLGVGAPIGGYLLFPPFFEVWLAWMILGTLLFAYAMTQWYLDAWIITSMAVIDNEWNSLFNKSTTRIEYQSIEGISTETKGFWSTILRFGDIQVEHMSAEPVVLKDVSRPRKVERMILLHQQSFLRRQNFEDHGKLKDLLTNLLRSKVD